ncbi:CGNR zinc finger domain-containing protein [Microbacterium sp. A84]|uniref:CGNR zinc finger domain-containing protein n=1 Tax=Microbacterium sp. A84 TaxID=3450715 RepID=UPI003F41F8E5
MIHSFPCGDPALDFVGTWQARRNESPAEKLGTPAGLDAWFVESTLAPDGTSPTAEDLAAAIELREAIYALVLARLERHDLPEDDMTTVNTYAAHPPLLRVLHRDGRSKEGTSAAALSEIARGAIELVGGSEAGLLRECARPECTQVYIDRSRGQRREWCSMKTCGSRVKVAAYRSRLKAANG